MKTQRVVFLGITTLCFILLHSCSKENRIEKNLWNKGGEWNIKTVSFRQTSTNSLDNFNYAVSNAGTFVFQESGSGTITFTSAGFTEVVAFTYSNTEDNLTLIIDNEASIYDLDWEKNELELTLNESSFSDDGDLVTVTEIFNLEKK